MRWRGCVSGGVPPGVGAPCPASRGPVPYDITRPHHASRTLARRHLVVAAPSRGLVSRVSSMDRSGAHRRAVRRRELRLNRRQRGLARTHRQGRGGRAVSSVYVSLGGLSSLALLSLLSCYSPTRPFVRRTAVDPISFRLRRLSQWTTSRRGGGHTPRFVKPALYSRRALTASFPAGPAAIAAACLLPLPHFPLPPPVGARGREAPSAREKGQGRRRPDGGRRRRRGALSDDCEHPPARPAGAARGVVVVTSLARSTAGRRSRAVARHAPTTPPGAVIVWPTTIAANGEVFWYEARACRSCHEQQQARPARRASELTAAFLFLFLINHRQKYRPTHLPRVGVRPGFAPRRPRPPPACGARCARSGLAPRARPGTETKSGGLRSAQRCARPRGRGDYDELNINPPTPCQ